jgi:hypothetical protein
MVVAVLVVIVAAGERSNWDCLSRAGHVKAGHRRWPRLVGGWAVRIGTDCSRLQHVCIGSAEGERLHA